jgi:hypothetical protein
LPRSSSLAELPCTDGGGIRPDTGWSVRLAEPGAASQIRPPCPLAFRVDE